MILKRNKPGKEIPFSDLHCHLLPEIDDGAKNVEVSEKLLEMEKEQGISQIIFTPHFYPAQATLDEFLKERKLSAYKIRPLLEGSGMKFRFGAEVHMEPELLDMDLSKLTLGKTGYLLLEWPFGTVYPLWGEDLVDAVFEQEIIPVFAHVERYDWFWDDPDYLESFVDQGVICQVNAGTLLDEAKQKKALRLIDEDLIHIVASDAHSLHRRPVQLKAALEVVEKRLGTDTRDRLLSNADRIFHDESIEEKSGGGFGLFKKK